MSQSDKDKLFDERFQQWKIDSQSRLKSADIPPTDFFVTNVLARLPNNKEIPWKIPSLVLGFATLFLLFSLPQETPIPGVDDLLLTAETDAATAAILTDDSDSRDVLSLAWEEPV